MTDDHRRKKSVTRIGKMMIRKEQQNEQSLSSCLLYFFVLKGCVFNHNDRVIFKHAHYKQPKM